MAVKSTTKPKRKLPERYPRDQQIIIFEDMSELDHILDRLSELEKSLIELSETTSYEAWLDYTKHSLLYGIAGFLRKAYIEFERFYEREGWSYETDNNLKNDLLITSDFKWRLNELEYGRLIDMPARTFVTLNGTYEWPAYVARAYEPAQHACAYALFLAMLMMECACSEHELKSFMADLRYYLTKYHAASLEVAAGKHAVELFKLKEVEKNHQAITDGGKKGNIARYGTNDEKSKKRQQWQSWIDAAIAEHPTHSFESIKSIVVKNHTSMVSKAQLKRYTKDSRIIS